MDSWFGWFCLHRILCGDVNHYPRQLASIEELKCSRSPPPPHPLELDLNYSSSSQCFECVHLWRCSQTQCCIDCAMHGKQILFCYYYYYYNNQQRCYTQAIVSSPTVSLCLDSYRQELFYLPLYNWTTPVAGFVDVSANPNTHKSLLGHLYPVHPNEIQCLRYKQLYHSQRSISYYMQ